MDKPALRQQLIQRRTAHVAALPASTSALVFRRPPAPVMDLISSGATIAVYHQMPGEAPATGYARFLYEQGHRIALPWFADRKAPMAFREWTNPFMDDLLEPDPFKALHPPATAPLLEPAVVFVPLLGFTDRGGRIGYGGGHYDRWLGAHPAAIRIGMAWDCQLEPDLPLEAHDIMLNAVVTPTRFYGPWNGADR